VGIAAAGLLGRVGPDLAPFASSMAQLGDREHVLCALPFALTVR
jgi:hypothetical protein